MALINGSIHFIYHFLSGRSASVRILSISCRGAGIRWRPGKPDLMLAPSFASFGFPGGSDGKESACKVGDLGSISGLGRSPGGGHGNPL